MKREKCPLCHHPRIRIHKYNKMTFREDIRLLECLKCGFIYADRVDISDNTNEDFFNIGNRLIQEWDSTRSGKKDRTYTYALNLLESIRSDSKMKNICDVGCATGLFLDLVCQQHNFKPGECLGVDLSKKMLKYCKEKGYRIFKP